MNAPPSDRAPAPSADDERTAIHPRDGVVPAIGPPQIGNVLPVGTRLAEFEITSFLAEGGFGIVYLANDLSLSRRVALKEYMPASLSSRTEAGVQVKNDRYREAFEAGRKSFVNEARLLAQFDHPSLVKVYRFWEANGTAYMVMPFYEGKNLRDTLRESVATTGAPPDEPWLRALLAPLTDALRMMHAEQCYHRDIAADNVMMLAGTGRPLLLDFGAARRAIGDMTQALTVILKPGYAPIEQYAEIPGMRQGPWTDVYALAGLVYFAITGKTPPVSVGRMLADSYQPLAQVAAGRYSPRFLEAIDRALVVRPEQRTQTIDAFREDLGLQEPAGSAPGSAAVMRPEADAATRLAPPTWASRATEAAKTWIRRAAEVTKASTPEQPARKESSPPEVIAPAPQAPLPDERTVLRSPSTIIPVPSSEAAAEIDSQTVIVGAGKGTGSAALAEARLVVTASDQTALVSTAVHVRGERLEIGRDPAADLQLADVACSRRHAAVLRRAGGFRIVDLGSANSTYLNGRPLAAGQEETLLFGAQIRIGQTTVTFLPAGAAEAPDDSGSELAGRYLLRERLRVSPKGAVYRAAMKGSDLPVAIKLLTAEAARLHDYQAQFQREAALAQRLRHPHICELRDYGLGPLAGAGRAVREVNYLCYSLLEGGDLASRLSRADRWPAADEALRWIGDVADALHFAHGHGVVHGNFKPSAVCFDIHGHAYVTDFASAVTAEGSASALLGAPAYMAPEQWAGKPAGAGTDQFALAVLAYTLFTGRRPFEGQEDPAQRERNFRRGPVPAHEEAANAGRPPVPASLSPVLHRALSADADRRFGSLEQFATALREAWHKRRPAGASAPPVFISYQRDKSAGWAVLVQRELADKHGIKSFVDAQRLDGAQRFPERIASAIRECEVFICLLAGTTLKSRWVREEIRLAHETGRPMIPIFQESFKKHSAPVDDPAVAALLQFDGLDLFDERNAFVHHTLADLARLVRETLGEPGSSAGAGGAGG